MTYNKQADFQALDPNTFIHIVEKALDRPLNNICRPYNSYINRVFELESADGESLVAKFYRPGRWSRETLSDEQSFLTELAAAEIPVIAPLPLANGSTLGFADGIHFSVFPKKGGRTTDELSEDNWLEVGRLLGRVHAVGEQHQADHRLRWLPCEVTRQQMETIISGGHMSPYLTDPYRRTVTDFIDIITPAFQDLKLIRLHGDFHFANLIYRPGESFYMIDFDDMVMGPAVQDMWMLLPGYRHETEQEISLLAEGYSTFRDFPYTELKLIEALRGMRYIHFSAWCARQALDHDFSESHPDWGSDNYWQNEIDDLKKQTELVREELS